MFGLGKKRTPLGKWMDKRGITQQWLSKTSKVSKETVSQLCSNEDKMPTGSTMKKILAALRQIDPGVRQNDFWDM